MDMPCCLALEGFFHGWGRDLVLFFYFFQGSSMAVHAVAGSGHPLGGLADVADDCGWFSLAKKCRGQQPSYTKTQYKPDLSQLGPWPLKGHLSMRALAAGKWGQLGWPSAVLVLGVRGVRAPPACLWGCDGAPWEAGRAILRSRSASPPPGGSHTAREISHRTGAYQGQNCCEI